MAPVAMVSADAVTAGLAVVVPAAASQEAASQEAVPAVVAAARGSCWRQIILHVCVCFKVE